VRPPHTNRRSASPRRLHPLPIRIMHWINAGVMLVMITSGWGIYDDDVIIHGLHVSGFWRLGEWAAPSLQWHFAGMWIFGLNGLAYLAYGLVTGRLRERLLPIRLRDVLHTVRDTLRFKIAHEDLTVYNAVQKILYIVAILAAIVAWFAVQAKQWVWVGVFALIVVLWNPIYPWPWEGGIRIAWIAAQPVTAIVFLVAGAVIKVRRA